MIENQEKLRLAFSGLFVFIALVIVADFVLPGRVLVDEIMEIQQDRQQYNNAARNYHYSYKVITTNNQFSVSEGFAESLQENQEIEYSVSPIFKEINWYKLLRSENRAIYSMRIISGLLLPVLVLITIGIAFRYKKNIGFCTSDPLVC